MLFEAYIQQFSTDVSITEPPMHERVIKSASSGPKLAPVLTDSVKPNT